MAVEAVVRKLLDGDVPPVGCAACDRELELADYERLFARRTSTPERATIRSTGLCTRAARPRSELPARFVRCTTCAAVS